MMSHRSTNLWKYPVPPNKNYLVVVVGEELLLVHGSFFLLSLADRRLFKIGSGSQFLQYASPLKFLLEPLQRSVY